MPKKLSLLLQTSFYTFGCVCLASNPAIAQVTSDSTVNTQVNQNGTIAEITGGETRGGNLFHSFQDFSVSTGNEAFFDNANNINNIFSRVTGGNISNIDGAIRANGNASLFLVNPAGIIFGENARLDLGGSFFGTTSSSILFEGGEFSATDLTNPPLLTVNAPIGLSFRDNPGGIVNRSIAQNNAEETVGLEVNSGNDLTLVGGDITFEAGRLTARGGKVELGGLSQAGNVSIDEDSNLVFAPDIELSNIELVDDAVVDVLGDGKGTIKVNANNLELNEESLFLAGIRDELSSVEEIAGDIDINLRDRLLLDGESFIISDVDHNARGTSGNINLNAPVIEIKNRSEVIARNNGIGNGGDITVNANEILLEENAFFRTEIDDNTVGNAGDIDITTNLLTLDDGLILSRIKNNSQGATGSITIVATEAVNLNDGKIDTALDPDSVATAGAIDITTPTLSLENGSRIRSRTLGQGDAGDIIVNAGDRISIQDSGIFSEVDADNRDDNNNNAVGNAGTITLNTEELLLNDSRISSVSFSQGDAGDIFINASDRVILNESIIFSNLNDLSRGNFDAVGDAGDITVTTSELTLTNESRFISNTSGIGGVGNIKIDAENVNLDQMSLIISQIRGTGSGEGGRIEIDANNISLKDFSLLSTNTSRNATGDAGDIVLNADRINISEGAIVDAITENDSLGGNIDLTTRVLTIATGGKVITSTDGGGNAGNINLTVTENLNIDGSNPRLDLLQFNEFDEVILNQLRPNTGIFISASETAMGNGGSAFINAGNLSLSDRAEISASTSFGTGGNINLNIDNRIDLKNSSSISAQAFNQADGGNINIDTDFLIAFLDDANGDGNDLVASAQAGEGGNITITADSLLGIQERQAVPENGTNDIDVTSEFGLSGQVSIFTPDINNLEGAIELPQGIVDGEQTVSQACRADRSAGIKNTFTVIGKGGVAAEPGSPLESYQISIGGEDVDSISFVPETIETSQGNIQPARGIKLTDEGEIILTAYRTDNSGDRIINKSSNCGNYVSSN